MILEACVVQIISEGCIWIMEYQQLWLHITEVDLTILAKNYA